MASRAGAAFDIREAIERVLLADAESYSQRDPETFYASQIGFCERHLYLRNLGLVDTDDVVGKFRTSSLMVTSQPSPLHGFKISFDISDCNHQIFE